MGHYAFRLHCSLHQVTLGVCDKRGTAQRPKRRARQSAQKANWRCVRLLTCMLLLIRCCSRTHGSAIWFLKYERCCCGVFLLPLIVLESFPPKAWSGTVGTEAGSREGSVQTDIGLWIFKGPVRSTTKEAAHMTASKCNIVSRCATVASR